jgi:hypothetical protein
MEVRMKRLAMSVPVLLALGFLALTAHAKLKPGDRVKVGGYLVTYTNPQLAGDDQEKGLRDFVDWFGQGGRSKELADVVDITDLLAVSAARPNQTSGVRTREFAPFENVKVTCAVSVPKKYAGTKDSEPWPLVYCVPDRGMKPEEYLDRYWTGAIRETCIIAAVQIVYEEKEVTTRKAVQGEDGKLRYENVKEKIPFSWGSDDAFAQFWGGLKCLLLFEFKINPNRVILDGAGFGAEGALYFASRQAWRFAGFVLRGGSLSGPSVENLAHLNVLEKPGEMTAEARKPFDEVRAAMKGLIKDRMVDGAAMDEAAVAKWVMDVRRDRYPLPQKWVHEGAEQQWGYWFGILGVFDPEKLSTVTLKADRAKKRVDIDTENVSELRLFVNDILVDMEQPFDLYVNGEVVRKQVLVSRSALQVLAHAFEKPPADSGVVFPGEVSDLAISPPKPAEGGAKPDGEGSKGEAPKGEAPKGEAPKGEAPKGEAPKDKAGEQK